MKDILLKLREIKSENCISLILNTHRTFPDSDQDAIVLKNLVTEASNRLLEHLDKRQAKKLIDKMQELADSIDHRMNQEALILFVNEEMAEFVRLTIEVTDRVIIDTTFATRDLFREINQQTHYYILVLSKEETRLIEAVNDKDVGEVGKPFPIKNADHSKTFSQQSKSTNRERDLIGEYFNFVDKQVNELRKDKRIKVLICSEEENYHEYLKIADQPESIYGVFLNRSRQTEKSHAIVTDAWQLVKEITEKKNLERKEELDIAVGNNKFLHDTNDIRMAIQEGRVQTLFIEEGLYSPAIIKKDKIIYKNPETNMKLDVIDDIYDELIELNMDFGGDVVFLPEGELKDFKGFGAVTRY